MKKFLYSPGWGAGWSTWNGNKAFCLFYQPIIDFLEEGDSFTRADCESFRGGPVHPLLVQFQNDYREASGTEACILGASTLAVGRVVDGEQIRIDEYDGSESYRVRSDDEGWY